MPRGSKVSITEGDKVKRSVADVPGGAWVPTMEVFDSVRRSKVVMRYPLVLANIVSPQLDEVLHTTISNTTVKDLLYFKLLFAINEDQIGWRAGTAARERVRRSRVELHNGEDRVERGRASQWRRQGGGGVGCKGDVDDKSHDLHDNQFCRD
jgi:hypothetical protein